jgi:hypothetical protein
MLIDVVIRDIHEIKLDNKLIGYCCTSKYRFIDINIIIFFFDQQYNYTTCHELNPTQIWHIVELYFEKRTLISISQVQSNLAFERKT